MMPIPFTQEKKDMSALFGLPESSAKKTAPVRIYERPHPFVPTIDPDYTFDINELRNLIAWFLAAVDKNYFLFGPTGSGKTSLIEQFCARLGIPVFKMSCNNKRTYNEFVGQWILKSLDQSTQPKGQVTMEDEDQMDGNTVTRKGTVTTPDGNQVAVTMEYSLGPIPSALIHQGVLLLDEADQLTPTTFMSFNEVLDDFPSVYIPEINRKIESSGFFRVAATGNSNGWGDSTGQYRGVQTQNIATLDRFWIQKKRETTAEEDIEYLTRKVPKVPKDALKMMVDFAMECRAAAVGQDGGSLNVPITRRTLRHWANMTVTLAMQKVSAPLQQAFNSVILSKGEPVDQEAMLSLWKRISGDNTI